ncbi:MAG TPA: hypothetical protein VEA81_08155 [Burkholderiaceae bacterium]|nr:hypothetical protein [Burkholderiaceae bacterium]
MHPLEIGELGRLLRDLEAAAPVASRRAAPQAEQYLWLSSRVRRVDVRTDAAFQQRLARHVGLRGKLRADKQALFDLLHELRDLQRPSFEDVLERVSLLTGQVEKSVASSLLALLDADQPAIDRDVRELLPRYGVPMLAEAPSFDECVDWHRRLQALFAQVLASPRWPTVSARLDAGLPAADGAVLSETRKLNLHMTHARRVVALMPSLEVVRARPPAVALRAERHAPPPVRLHLCR